MRIENVRMKKCMKIGIVSFLCIVTAFAGAKVSGTGKLEAVGLRCEYLVNPLGIDVVQPRLGWRLDAGVRKT